MDALQPPLALVEEEDEEFLFFASLDQMLNDTDDVLWGDSYVGWDTAGTYFSLVRREGRRRWWHRILSADSTYLTVDRVQPATRVEEAERRIRQQLQITGSNLAELIAAGVDQTKKESNQPPEPMPLKRHGSS
jgi:hypothetical protein